MSHPSTHNQAPAAPNLEITPWIGASVSEYVSSHTEGAQTIESRNGLECVDIRGEVGIIPGEDGAFFNTDVGSVELAAYNDGDVDHRIILHGVTIIDRDPHTGRQGFVSRRSLFVVDQTVGQDGEKRLAATPGVLYRFVPPNAIPEERRAGEFDMSSDNTQLTNAVLAGLGGGEGLRALMKDMRDGKEESVSTAREALVAALKSRGPERVTLGELSSDFWRVAGIETQESRDRQRAAYVERRDRELAEYKATNPLGRLALRIIHHMTHPDQREVPPWKWKGSGRSSR